MSRNFRERLPYLRPASCWKIPYIKTVKKNLLLQLEYIPFGTISWLARIDHLEYVLVGLSDFPNVVLRRVDVVVEDLVEVVVAVVVALSFLGVAALVCDATRRNVIRLST